MRYLRRTLGAAIAALIGFAGVSAAIAAPTAHADSCWIGHDGDTTDVEAWFCQGAIQVAGNLVHGSPNRFGHFAFWGPNGWYSDGLRPDKWWSADQPGEVPRSTAGLRVASGQLICIRFSDRNANGSYTQYGGDNCAER